MPDDFTSVQTALDSSASGDTVLIGSGEYIQSLNAPLHDVTIASEFIFSGDTTQISECVLRPPIGSVGRNLSASRGADHFAIHVVGLSFVGSTNGNDIVGGGIAAYGRTLLLDHCFIDSTYSNFGGGLFADSCNVTVSNCRFRTASAWERGLVAYFQDCDVLVEQTQLLDGFPAAPGPSGENVIMIDGGSILLRQCTIEGFGWDNPPGVTGIRQLGVGTSIVIVDCEIRDNRIHNFFRLPEEGILQFSLIRFDSNRVIENEFQHDLFSYFGADTGSVCVFRNNSFVNNHRLSVGGFVSRMLFTLAANSQFTEVSRNVFVENESQENSVAAIGSPADSTNLKFHNNYIFNNACDGFANPPGGVTMLVSVPSGVVYHNVYSQSIGYAAFQGLHSSPPSFAPINYWGDSTGPRQEDENPIGLGDSVENLVHVVPWLADSADITGNSRVITASPTSFALGYPFPNPFNSSVTIEYALAREQAIRLTVYDVQGRLVSTLLEEVQGMGVHQVVWDAEGVSTGVYFARLQSMDGKQASQAVKLMLVK